VSLPSTALHACLVPSPVKNEGGVVLQRAESLPLRLAVFIKTGFNVAGWVASSKALHSIYGAVKLAASDKSQKSSSNSTTGRGSALLPTPALLTMTSTGANSLVTCATSLPGTPSVGEVRRDSDRGCSTRPDGFHNLIEFGIRSRGGRHLRALGREGKGDRSARSLVRHQSLALLDVAVGAWFQLPVFPLKSEDGVIVGRRGSIRFPVK
jgi:hypothetical protein